ncbi:hypothetical protein KBI23_06335 [bacterium]|nr:hypothetical protein [bacterium]MBP9809484.1 hypothetical protein [bacterium]
MNLPAKTAYTLTYKATNQAEVWQGGVYFCSTRRLLILNTIVCVLAALTTASKLSIATFIATFFGILIAYALFFFLTTLCLAFLHTASILFLSKFYGACTTTIDEEGIRDSLGQMKFNYKWHQIRDIEMKKGSIYVIALVNGIQIPSCAFASSEEAEAVFALAKQYKAAAQQKRNRIAAGGDTPVQDPDLLLKSLQDEEEAKWLEIENKHKEQNRE